MVFITINLILGNIQELIKQMFLGTMNSKYEKGAMSLFRMYMYLLEWHKIIRSLENFLYFFQAC